MKKTTLMKSVLTLIAAFVLALPARAQVASMADLFGTYKFTADVTVTDAGKDLADNFKSECDVTITKCSYGVYDGEIQGLAGATAAQSINGIDLTANTIKITNPNGNGLWSGGLYMSNTEGVYPFGGGYSDILYTFDPATKTITLPDFTLVTCDHANSAATIAASFTNAKLTLVASESIEVADLSGNWHFTAGTGTYDVMEGSTLPTEFDMTLTATDDTKKAYDITLALGDFAPLAMTATFDGVTLNIPFNETYLDAENKIGFVYYGGKEGNITFNMLNENLLSLSSGIYIVQDSISPEVPGGYLQYYTNGSAKRESGEVEAVTWEGTYTVKAGSIYKAITDYEYPETFEMEVVYYAETGMYFVTKFMGEDVAALNYGGILLTPSAEDPNKAEIKAGGFLKTIVGGEKYLCLKDMNLSDGALTLTRLEDGTYTISDFSAALVTYGSDQAPALAAFYQTVTAEKAPETAPFTWAQTFTVKGDVTAYDGNTYPETFEMEVQYFEDWGMYLVTKFFGNDVTALNNGGILFNISEEDPTKAEMNTGGLIGTVEAGVTYYKLLDMNATTSPLTLTLNEDGTVSISSFCVSTVNWNTGDTKAVALYNNVVATTGGTVEPEPEPEPFNWAQTFTVKGNVTAYDGNTYPETFEMEVQYFEDWSMYLVTKFFGNDVTALNNGGILFNISEEDPTKAEMNTGGLVGTVEAGVTYYKLLDMNATTSPLTLTLNEDGTVSISSFCVSTVNWNTGDTKAVALYDNVVATTGGTVEPEPEPEPFNWAGTFTVSAKSISVYNETYAYPNDFEMEIQYFEDWGMYLVTKFLGNDVTGLNYGGIGFTPSTEDPNKAEMSTGGLVGTIEAGATYFQLFDMNATTNPITLTANEDGTISISSFCISVMDWNTKEAKAAALYSEVTAITGYDSIEEIETAPSLKAWAANGTIYVAGEAQEIDVYDMSGRVVFSGVASQVNGLSKGLYLVKVKNAVAKVSVK